ncbi:MAG: serine/threonine-protein phosphatase, partial [Elusimicrobia bacterium]|nr:serine/threonine-protein phosphatase [Elusimicrobiota bacterium]
TTTIPLYHSTTGSVEVIQSGGFVLGMLPEIETYLENKELKLNSGDKVILYTDGVTEARDPREELYTLERLIASVQKHGHKPAEELIEALRQEVYGFISTQDQYDDITLVGIEAE